MELHLCRSPMRPARQTRHAEIIQRAGAARQLPGRNSRANWGKVRAGWSTDAADRADERLARATSRVGGLIGSILDPISLDGLPACFRQPDCHPSCRGSASRWAVFRSPRQNPPIGGVGLTGGARCGTIRGRPGRRLNQSPSGRRTARFGGLLPLSKIRSKLASEQ